MRFKTLFHCLLLTVLSAGIVALFFYISLPFLIKTQLKKKLMQLPQVQQVEFDIERIGYASTRVSGISLNNSLHADRLAVFYDLRQLPDLRIKKVFLSGITVNLEVNEKKQVIISGLDPAASPAQKENKTKTGFLSFLPKNVVLKNSRLNLAVAGRQMSFPIDATIALNKENKTARINAGSYLFGQKVEAGCNLDFFSGPDQIHLKMDRVDFAAARGVVSQWGIDLPEDIILKNFNTAVRFSGQKFGATGSTVFANDLVTGLTLSFRFHYDPDSKMPYHLFFENKETVFSSNQPGVNARFEKSWMKGSFQAAAQKGKGSFSFSAGKADILAADQRITIVKPEISANILADFRQGKTRVRLTPKVTADKIETFFAGEKGEVPSKKLVMTDTAIELPLSFPAVPSGPSGQKAKSGTWRIPSALFDGKYDFSVDGRIAHDNNNQLEIDGELKSSLLPEKIDFTSRVCFENKPDATIHFNVPQFSFSQKDLEKILPGTDIKPVFNMMARVQGALEMSQGKIKSGMELAIKDGWFELPDVKLVAQGINSTIRFSDLKSLKSVPGQLISIDTVNIDKIRTRNAKIRFSIEDKESFLIENLRFNWCGGLVSSESVRLDRKADSYTLILYCDRLKLAQLLEQTGAFDSQGSGSLNGRIPVTYAKGRVLFDNGFLFSTPGSGGNVSIENPEKITQGIPMDSPQFAQLDLAQEALRDFNYKWAKLTFNTYEETLFIKMELDGKPSGLLPFEYNRELGGFARVDASSPGSRFQGIKLDVNLNLPFNDVLKFGNTLKSILK